MSKYIKFFISIFLLLILVFGLFNPLIVIASDSEKPPLGSYDSDDWNTYDNSDITNVIVDQLLNKGIHEGDADYYENFIRYATEYISYGLSQVGAVISRDAYALGDNSERLYQDLKNITDNGKIKVDKNSKRLVISKNFTDSALALLKEKTKEPENGGYELVKTVPLRQVSTLYFDTQQEFKTLVNLLNDNNGMIGFKVYNGYLESYFKLDSNVFWIKNAVQKEYIGYPDKKDIISFRSVKNANSGSIGYGYRNLKDSTIPALNWDDKDNLVSMRNDSVYNFCGLETFDLYRNSPNETHHKNPFNHQAFIITKSGASIPVFNSLNDAIRYMVDHNLYYTSSDYTGEGKEIIIPFDEIDKILNGYYNGMYDLLQQLIEQNGGNALTPEQLQELVDEVKASFGMIQDTINKGFEQQDILIQKNSSILQNIADALNEFFRQTKENRKELNKMLKDLIEGKKGDTGGTGDIGTDSRYIKIHSVSNSSLAANQREFTIETNIINPYYESCLAWYPLNGVSDIQYTNGNTCILTFFNYNKRYNVYCKYNDSGQNIRCTSNTVSVTIGSPDSPIEESTKWDDFADGLNAHFTDIKNSIVDLHDDMNVKFDSLITAFASSLDKVFYNLKGENLLELINESINIHIENFEDFASDCIKAVKDLKNNTGGNKHLPALPAPDGGGDWDLLNFLMDIAKDIAANSIDEGAKKVGNLITEMLSGLGECFDMLSEVFPFSIPWDIAVLIGALSAEPQIPHFEIPIILEKYGINETFVIDLSGFEAVSRISRAFLSLIWAMYLMNFTIKFTDTKNL